MYLRNRSFLLLAMTAAFCTAALGQRPEISLPRSYVPPPFTRSAELEAAVEAAVSAANARFASAALKPDQFAVTVVDLSEGRQWQWASYRGETAIYPASVVKMFYMAAIERQLEDGRVMPTAELDRGLRDMIVDSSNEATQYILDVITGTSSGAELPPKQFEAWQYKRNIVNRWLTSMGYKGINVNQKTFCEDAYGIEQQSRGYKGQNRNMISTDATARMMAEIVTGRLNTPARTEKMMSLMRRDPWGKAADADDQNNGFTGRFFIQRDIRDVKLWSKAGWTSKTRHDVAYIEMPDGQRFVIAVYTEDHANERDIIPTIAGVIYDRFRAR